LAALLNFLKVRILLEIGLAHEVNDTLDIADLCLRFFNLFSREFKSSFSIQLPLPHFLLLLQLALLCFQYLQPRTISKIVPQRDSLLHIS
jgi:hypothetical protein